MSKASTGHAESAWLLRFQIEAENGSDSWEEDARRELGAASPVHPYLTTTHSGSFRPSLIRHTDGPLPLARESFNSTFLQSHTQAQKRALSHLPPFLRAPTRERGALWGAPEVPGTAPRLDSFCQLWKSPGDGDSCHLPQQPWKFPHTDSSISSPSTNSRTHSCLSLTPHQVLEPTC